MVLDFLSRLSSVTEVACAGSGPILLSIDDETHHADPVQSVQQEDKLAPANNCLGLVAWRLQETEVELQGQGVRHAAQCPGRAAKSTTDLDLP